MKRNVTIFLLFCVSMLTHVHLMAQQLQIQGHVTDRANGSAITHATIQVVGTSTTTAPNDKGFFTIRVPNAKSQVQVKAIGYATKTVSIINPAEFLEIQLDGETGNIDEVVVVGYGTQTKATVTGAISSVKAKDLENMPLTRVEQALQGRTSGVLVMTNSGQPGSAANVRVRGTTSINGNDPLWVVDGVVVDNGGIGFINQSDIESLDVLKDASAQAIYGARAANGVILVTTKKGRIGAPSISYNGFFGTSAPAKKLKLTDATQYATLRNESLKNDGKAPLFADPASFGKGTDWQEELFNNGAIRHNHEFSVSGGSEKSTYYTSFGYLDQQGIVATEISKYKRLNFRLNSTYSPASWITFGQNIGYARDKSVGLGNTNSEFGGPLSSAINLDPITPVVVTDPAVAGQAPYTTPFAVRDAFGNPYGISPYVAQEMTNPMAFIQTRLGNYSWSDNIVGNAFAELMPIEGLKYRSSLGTKLAFWGNEGFTPQFYMSPTSKNDKANFSRGMNRMMDWNFENTISYTKDFNNHKIGVLVGHGAYMRNNSYNINGTYFGIPVDNFDEASMNFPVPNTDKNLGGGEGIVEHIQSFFGRVNYNFKDRYLFEALVRRDGSTKFGPQNKYGTFPSVSAGWVVSSEDFWNQDNATVNFLKLRAGYGVVGNDNIGNFGYTAVIGGGRNYSFGTGGAYLTGNSPNSVPNPNLKWEETKSANIGLEAVLFQNLSLSIDVFDKRTTGILQNVRLPQYVGVVSDPPANIGALTNRGFELSLGYNKKQGDWTYGASGNVSYVKNKITDLGGFDFLATNYQTFQNSSYEITRTILNQPVYSFYGMRHLGVFQNQQEVDAYVGPNGGKIQPNAKPGDFKWEDINGDGVINENDRAILGSPIPTWTYGINLNAAYKDFDISVFGQGSGGNKIFQGLRRLDINASNYQEKALDRWTGEGTSNTHPRLTDDDANRNYRNPSQFYLEKGDYFRLKVVQLGYTFRNFSSYIGARNLRVYVMAENLFTITKYTGYDPEIGGGSNNSGMGIDRGRYPQARSFMFGLNIGF
ncbi:SusC/RagA family TonB-linked outer membrane protein [Sphingobacterium sp. MYb382]|uniref:SusC/RagA family TonB-linked outer membrane protein n=1 Tax=Sphingobacterium sp. MYb382 TaxID=2745278 RepID=UPI0030B2B0C4